MSLTSEDHSLEAGRIKRHPDVQRASPLRRWLARVGAFDLAKAGEINVVSDGNGGWYAVDGATRVEACNDSKKYGPGTVLRCKVWGNGRVPTPAEIAGLFNTLNVDRTEVSAGIKFRTTLIEGRPEALAAQECIAALGSKFRSTTGIWSLVLRHGVPAMRATVEEIARIWGTDYHIPMQVVTAVHAILRKKHGAATLRARTKALRRKTPDQWWNDATRARLQTVGNRASTHVYVMEKLLGRRSSK